MTSAPAKAPTSVLFVTSFSVASGSRSGLYLSALGTAMAATGLVVIPLQLQAMAWAGLTMAAATLVAALSVALNQPRGLILPKLVSGLGRAVYRACLSGRLMADGTSNCGGASNDVRATLINGSNGLSTAFAGVYAAWAVRTEAETRS